jgi:glutamate-1-semialdehyde 2,1-aminomutase
MGVVPPKEGFLQFLRDITEENGTVLIFDEVITGFRLSVGGAQEYYGIKPDMTTLGKIVGGGMPMAVYGGKKEIMECVSPVGKVYQAGTLSGNPVATAAGIKTVELLMADPGIYDKIDASAKKLADAYRTCAKEKGIDMTVNQVGSLLCAYFTKEEVDNYDKAASSDLDAFSAYFGKMLDNGIYVAPSQFEAMFVSAAHTEEEIKRTCDLIKAL